METKQKAITSSIDEEYKKVISEATAKSKTEALISEISERATTIINTAQKIATKDYNITILRNMEKLNIALRSNNVTKVTVNKTTDKLSITLLNGYVYKVMSCIYGCDFIAVYNAINEDYAKLSAFNQAIAEQIKTTTELFINRL